MINNDFQNKYEHLISYNQNNYNIIFILDNSQQYLSISVNDELNSFYEINLTLEELIHLCKVFKSCDSIEDVYQMLINYVKSKKVGIKDISKNYLTIYIKIEVLGKEKIIELSLNKTNKPPHPQNNIKESPSEINKIKLDQKTISEKLENALETINKLKNELENSKNLNAYSYLSTQIQEIENENGDKYIGNIYNNKKEGRGKMIYKNGEVYIGEWFND